MSGVTQRPHLVDVFFKRFDEKSSRWKGKVEIHPLLFFSGGGAGENQKTWGKPRQTQKGRVRVRTGSKWETEQKRSVVTRLITAPACSSDVE